MAVGEDGGLEAMSGAENLKGGESGHHLDRGCGNEEIVGRGGGDHFAAVEVAHQITDVGAGNSGGGKARRQRNRAFLCTVFSRRHRRAGRH